ncbi:unnamed protein product [Allacma fusca]|uniref:CRAL-TRIO domain-containing protein n=1 Tax=Allacma fusca TaxID=39272 RepID=A0A8J2L0G3_9HEXA|nr:unnamed protein product [Allacma fusca]
MSLHRLFIIATSVFVLGIEGNFISADAPGQSLKNKDILEWEAPESIKEKFPYYLSGFDYDRKPVVVMEFGGWDTLSLLKKGPEALVDVDKRNDQFAERLRTGFFNSLYPNGSSETSDDEVAIIFDFDGLQFRQLTSPENVKYLMKTFAKFEKASDQIGYGFLINANTLVEQMLILVKPFMGKFLERVEVYGTKSEIWKPLLLRRIPRSQLPLAYGGTKKFRPVSFYG